MLAKCFIAFCHKSNEMPGYHAKHFCHSFSIAIILISLLKYCHFCQLSECVIFFFNDEKQMISFIQTHFPLFKWYFYKYCCRTIKWRANICITQFWNFINFELEILTWISVCFQQIIPMKHKQMDFSLNSNGNLFTLQMRKMLFTSLL